VPKRNTLLLGFIFDDEGTDGGLHMMIFCINNALVIVTIRKQVQIYEYAVLHHDALSQFHFERRQWSIPGDIAVRLSTVNIPVSEYRPQYEDLDDCVR
jgi:hypothetical protein